MATNAAGNFKYWEESRHPGKRSMSKMKINSWKIIYSTTMILFLNTYTNLYIIKIIKQLKTEIDAIPGYWV